MKVSVIEEHKSSFPNPIRLKKGEVVKVEKRVSEFVGWIWTITNDGNSGWAPEPLLDISGAGAKAKEDYNAHELSTEIGEELTVYRELNEWYWVSNSVGGYGWVPVKSVTKT